MRSLSPRSGFNFERSVSIVGYMQSLDVRCSQRRTTWPCWRRRNSGGARGEAGWRGIVLVLSEAVLVIVLVIEGGLVRRREIIREHDYDYEHETGE